MFRHKLVGTANKGKVGTTAFSITLWVVLKKTKDLVMAIEAAHQKRIT
jgi:hypothetical protein